MLGRGAGGWRAEVACPRRPAERLRPFQSEKLLLYDTLQGELQERIQRLEEDRQSLDISSGEAALGAALPVRTPSAALPARGACRGAHFMGSLWGPQGARHRKDPAQDLARSGGSARMAPPALLGPRSLSRTGGAILTPPHLQQPQPPLCPQRLCS